MTTGGTMIIGDIHGKVGDLNNLLNKKRPELAICCGDFGYWPGWSHDLTDIRLQHTKKVLWCDGNHEDHWALAKRESDEIVPGVIYMPRGSTYTLPDGRTIMFMGGAESIDRYRRELGIDWFPEEIITQRDLMDLPDVKVDIFITHTCPVELVNTLSYYYPDENQTEPSNYALTALMEKYNPSLWYFGHWHQYINGVINDTTAWTCLDYPGHGGRWWEYLPD